ncbi:helix-turn-helix domain-containing protein [Ottowia testudinis]|uniref:Transcriptional regulator n=1 Tax=Ottowia testudinis TaxID=2816950 RepID=A0A975CG97_9BURK|nr:transcriptional regulator [Ottowia testudinis]QTD44546.1 transcriptional regulator [Ottowia testudinis]
MELKPIRTEADYRSALAEASRLFDLPEEPAPDSQEGAFFDALLTLIEGYERKHYPIDAPDPIEAIKFTMDQRDLTVADLVPYIGARNRVYEVLAGKRPLTLAMIRRLSAGLGIPAGVLVGA